MVTNELITLYRQKVSSLLCRLRYSLFLRSGNSSFPTDASIAFLLGITPTALSSISRQCSSMSGTTFLKLIQLLSEYLDDESFLSLMRDFSDFSDVHVQRI